MGHGLCPWEHRHAQGSVLSWEATGRIKPSCPQTGAWGWLKTLVKTQLFTRCPAPIPGLSSQLFLIPPCRWEQIPPPLLHVPSTGSDCNGQGQLFR